MSDFIELLEQHGVEKRTSGQHHHAREGWVQLDCPFCSPGSHRFRLGYNISSRTTNCWSCGRLQLIDVLMAITGESRRSCFDLIHQLPRGDGDFRSTVSGHTGRFQLPEGDVALGTLGIEHRQYLLDRGFNPKQLLKLWELGCTGIGVERRLQYRIIIPIHREGEIVSWTSRSISDDGIRYITASNRQSSVPISQVLYGMDYVRNSVVVCEGPTDVWKIGPGAVALLGLSVSPWQMEWLSRIPNRLICLDNRPEAMRTTRHLYDNLAVFGGKTYKVTLSGKDAADSDESEIEEIRAFLR